MLLCAARGFVDGVCRATAGPGARTRQLQPQPLPFTPRPPVAASREK